MVAQLQLVKGMPLSPCACTLCGGNPINEATNEPYENVFAPGVDVNWGDSVYICHSCAEIISDLMGRSTVEGFDKLTMKYQKLKEEYDELKEDHEKAKALLKRIADGKVAVKEVKKGKVTT